METQEAVVEEAQCEEDHLSWVEEITTWKKDHARALEMLAETVEFIQRHDAELEDHLKEIETHREHHRAGGGPTPEMRAKHLEVRERHNIFRGRHRGLMDEVVRLRVALHKSAHGRPFD